MFLKKRTNKKRNKKQTAISCLFKITSLVSYKKHFIEIKISGRFQSFERRKKLRYQKGILKYNFLSDCTVYSDNVRGVTFHSMNLFDIMSEQSNQIFFRTVHTANTLHLLRQCKGTLQIVIIRIHGIFPRYMITCILILIT